MVEAAEEAVSASTSATSTVSGLIRVAAPKSLANQVLRPIFFEFIKHYPDIQLHIKVTDLVLDPIHDAVDFLIHINDRPIESLVNIKLGKVGQVLCASPDYLQINPTPLHPDGLKKHACICLGDNATNNQQATVQVSGSYLVNHSEMRRDAIEQGFGILVHCPTTLLNKPLNQAD